MSNQRNAFFRRVTDGSLWLLVVEDPKKPITARGPILPADLSLAVDRLSEIYQATDATRSPAFNAANLVELEAVELERIRQTGDKRPDRRSSRSSGPTPIGNPSITDRSAVDLADVRRRSGV